ncbi:import receptor subunit tom40 [Anaeramoeba flamelloides]|uniref:Import receptor subunit tom40 n=1 Tax=Anaeramoeba flamelloides TaxID=1746091 RepID=A0ABQ8Z3U7_9EUKA|nr:import receptor subunit tom40 [Anaeramoeba flamelloides]
MQKKEPKQEQKQEQKEKTSEQEEAIPPTNPGRFDNILREAQTVLNIETSDGVTLRVNQQLNPFFSLIHTLQFGSIFKPPNYIFSSRFLTKNYAFLGDIDKKGNLSSRFFHQTTPKLLTNLFVEIENEKKITSSGVDLEYYSADFTGKLRMQSDKSISVSYLQSLSHPNLIGGVEVSYKGNSKKTEIRSSARYTRGNSIYSVEYSDTHAKHLSINYVKKISQRIGLATDFIYNLETGVTHSSVGLRYHLRKSRFATLIRSSGSISTMYEELYHPLASMKITGDINYLNNQYFFGFSLRFGPEI